MNNINPYQVVSCAMHSELELVIMHEQTLIIYYVENNKEQTIKFKPRDIITRGSNERGEFLTGSDESGKQLEIRLDSIIRFISA